MLQIIQSPPFVLRFFGFFKRYSIVKNDSQALALATNVDDPELRTWQVVYAASYKMGVYLLLGMDRDGLCSDAANLL